MLVNPCVLPFFVKWYSRVCPWKGRLTGSELQRRKTPQPPSPSISLGISLFEWFLLPTLGGQKIRVSTVVKIRAKIEPILRVPLVKCFFLQQQNIFMTFFNFCKCTESFKHKLFFNTHTQWISRYRCRQPIYITKTWPRTDPMDDFFRNGCRSTQPAIWRSLRGVMESATCCRTTRHRGMATLSRFPITRVNSGKKYIRWVSLEW